MWPNKTVSLLKDLEYASLGMRAHSKKLCHAVESMQCQQGLHMNALYYQSALLLAVTVILWDYSDNENFDCCTTTFRSDQSIAGVYVS